MRIIKPKYTEGYILNFYCDSGCILYESKNKQENILDLLNYYKNFIEGL